MSKVICRHGVFRPKLDFLACVAAPETLLSYSDWVDLFCYRLAKFGDEFGSQSREQCPRFGVWLYH